MSDDGSELSIEDLVDRLIAAGGPTPEATEEETAGREDRARRSRDGAAAAGITFRVGNLVQPHAGAKKMWKRTVAPDKVPG